MVSKKKFVTTMLIAVIGLIGVGCSDDNPVEPTIIDEAPIIPPTKLSVELDKGKAKLEWGPSVDYRVVNYFVDREHEGDRVSLGKTGLSNYQFVDENPPLGFSTYYVYAAGTGPRKSAGASVTLLYTLTHRIDDIED